MKETDSKEIKTTDIKRNKIKTLVSTIYQQKPQISNILLCLPPSEEKAMYSAELEKLKKEKEEWKRKAQRLEDQASALQVNQKSTTDQIIC